MRNFILIKKKKNGCENWDVTNSAISYNKSDKIQIPLGTSPWNLDAYIFNHHYALYKTYDIPTSGFEQLDLYLFPYGMFYKKFPSMNVTVPIEYITIKEREILETFYNVYVKSTKKSRSMRKITTIKGCINKGIN